ncbi:MAG: hypothetical protein ACREQV_08985 [Candidatus Binatia bacterium]
MAYNDHDADVNDRLLEDRGMLWRVAFIVRKLGLSATPYHSANEWTVLIFGFSRSKTARMARLRYGIASAVRG